MEGFHSILRALSFLFLVVQSYAEVTLTGKAFGAGYLQNCTVGGETQDFRGVDWYLCLYTMIWCICVCCKAQCCSALRQRHWVYVLIQVILTVGTVNATTTTDATGSFSFSVPDLTNPQQLTGGLLYMPNGPHCIDTATHQQVPLDMGALIPTYAAGGDPYDVCVFHCHDTVHQYIDVQRLLKGSTGPANASVWSTASSRPCACNGSVGLSRLLVLTP